MNKPIRILGIAGSLRSESFNRAALRAATQSCGDHGRIDRHYRHSTVRRGGKTD